MGKGRLISFAASHRPTTTNPQRRAKELTSNHRAVEA
jgi:hypothetical protein